MFVISAFYFAYFMLHILSYFFAMMILNKIPSNTMYSLCFHSSGVLLNNSLYESSNTWSLLTCTARSSLGRKPTSMSESKYLIYNCNARHKKPWHWSWWQSSPSDLVFFYCYRPWNGRSTNPLHQETNHIKMNHREIFYYCKKMSGKLQIWTFTFTSNSILNL